MPKVSVIIPTYNRAEFLCYAIESAIHQTYSDIEIIVSDDKSTDRTKSVVENFQDSRVKYLLNDGNKGPSAARNFAILAAKGKYIAFLDDDDEWFPNKLQCQVEVLENCDAKICGVHSDYLELDRSTNRGLEKNPPSVKLRGNLFYDLGLGNPIRTTTLMIKKQCIDEVGLFDENIAYMEDRDLLIRLSRKWDFEFISEPLVKYYHHDKGNLTANIEGQIAGKETLFKRYPEIFKINRKRWSEYILGLGVQYCQINEMKKGRKNLIKSISIYPIKSIAYLHLLSSLFGNHNYHKLRRIYKMNFLSRYLFIEIIT